MARSECLEGDPKVAKRESLLLTTYTVLVRIHLIIQVFL